MEADLAITQGKLPPLGKRAITRTQRLHRGSGNSTYTTGTDATRETPSRGSGASQPDAREGQAGRGGESEGLVVPEKPGNAGGGKGPLFKPNVGRGEGGEIE